jgi:GH24 family phage-related lysozyme (muramidase)
VNLTDEAMDQLIDVCARMIVRASKRGQMTDMDEYIDILRRWEGCVPWMYLDTRGYVTVGIGCMLPFVDAALRLQFRNVNAIRAATIDEVRIRYEQVKSLVAGRSASLYWMDHPRIELPVDACERIAIERLEREFLPELRRLFAGIPNVTRNWDTLPLCSRVVLVDIAWNVGTAGIAKFHRLIAHVLDGDWHAASEEVATVHGRVERNEWRRETMAAAGKV